MLNKTLFYYTLGILTFLIKQTFLTCSPWYCLENIKFPNTKINNTMLYITVWKGNPVIFLYNTIIISNCTLEDILGLYLHTQRKNGNLTITQNWEELEMDELSETKMTNRFTHFSLKSVYSRHQQDNFTARAWVMEFDTCLIRCWNDVNTMEYLKISGFRLAKWWFHWIFNI